MIHVASTTDMPRGSARRLQLTPPVSVFHTDEGEFYAIDDTCTHQDASLADGWLEGCQIECPLHAALFDLRTGEADGIVARKPVRTHRVLVDGEAVYLQLDATHPAAVVAGTAVDVAV